MIRVATIALVFAVAFSQATAEDLEPFRPDPQIQSVIDEAVRNVAVGQDESTLLQAAADLDRKVGDRAVLNSQLVFYLVMAKGTETAMSGAQVLHALQFTPQEKVRAMVPMLGSDDPGSNRIVEAVLASAHRRFEEGIGPVAPDFALYEPYLGPGGPEALVDFLFRASPSDALTAVAGVRISDSSELAALYADRYLLDNERQAGPVSETRLAALEALRRVAGSPHWWVRLYAVAVLAEAPTLRAPDVLEALLADPHARVRNAAAGLASAG